jgi:small subunit ribosomal protein S4
MAVNRVPVLKRCRALGLEPSYLGYDKKSNRTSARAGKKVSEYGLQLREKQKAKFWRSLSVTTMRRLIE